MNNLIVEKREEWVTTITINRPEALNALNRETLTELYRCLVDIRHDRKTRVVVITGAGEKAFVAGADISTMRSMNSLEAREFARLGHRVASLLEQLPQTVIAAVNGFALGGGCELALACDIRYASENARFGQPEVSLGVVPGFGGTQRLPRLVGKGVALEMLVSGEMIDANEALRIGLVNKVVGQQELLDSCYTLAETISSRGPLAVRLCKEAVRNGMEMEIGRACDYEAELFAICFSSPEQKEGMGAFLEKRKPDFSR